LAFVAGLFTVDKHVDVEKSLRPETHPTDVTNHAAFRERVDGSGGVFTHHVSEQTFTLNEPLLADLALMLSLARVDLYMTDEVRREVESSRTERALEFLVGMLAVDVSPKCDVRTVLLLAHRTLQRTRRSRDPVHAVLDVMLVRHVGSESFRATTALKERSVMRGNVMALKTG
jgi:hypothetical protein